MEQSEPASAPAAAGEAIFVVEQNALEGCLADLQTWPIISVDTEANSLHAYREQVCLIQFSTPETDYIVDPLAEQMDISVLGTLFADPSVEKIFHAAEYDITVLKADFDFKFANLFDTMIAARNLGYARLGLSSLLFQFWHIKLDKKWQRANWGKRPLPPEQIAYARFDTHYLLQLRNRLYGELTAKGLLAEAQEDFVALTQRRFHTHEFQADGFWRMQGIKKLQPRQRAILARLYTFRDREAQRLDRPPFKVLSNDALLLLAQKAPHRRGQLRYLTILGPYRFGRRAALLLEQIKVGETDALPKRRPVPRRDPAYEQRYQRLRTWRKEKAQQRGVSSDVILSTEALRACARLDPHTERELAEVDAIGPWRRAQYGAEIITLLNRKRSTKGEKS